MDVGDVSPAATNAAQQCDLSDSDAASARESDDPDPGADDAGQTAIVSDLPPNPAAELAWSADTDDPEPPRAASAAKYTLAVMAVVLAAGAVAVTGSILLDRMGRPAAAVSTSVAVSTATASPVAESPAPSTSSTWSGQIPSAVAEHETPPPNADDTFLAALARGGVPIGDPVKAVASGRSVCTYLAQGHTTVEAVRTLMSTTPTVTLKDTAGFVVAAVNVYCPERKDW
jgi:hypothetical protein